MINEQYWKKQIARNLFWWSGYFSIRIHKYHIIIHI